MLTRGHHIVGLGRESPKIDSINLPSTLDPWSKWLARYQDACLLEEGPFLTFYLSSKVPKSQALAPKLTECFSELPPAPRIPTWRTPPALATEAVPTSPGRRWTPRAFLRTTPWTWHQMASSSSTRANPRVLDDLFVSICHWSWMVKHVWNSQMESNV